MTGALFESSITRLELICRGKVRDVYAIDEDHLLIIASDRLSAFDVIMPQPIPGKGELLTRISNFWFARTQDIIPNHLAPMDLTEVIPDAAERAAVGSRATVARRLRPLPVEAVVRGHVIGSGWKDYRATGSICGIPLPEGLQQAERLDNPIFTPATKAAPGSHDENITFDRMVAMIGGELAERVRETSVRIYRESAGYALERGIIIADTKFEFGLDEGGGLFLIDEILTPDSSRFWPADTYRPGISPPSFDKQFVRDYLETLDWNKVAPGPRLPEEIIQRTAEKYREAERRLTAPDGPLPATSPSGTATHPRP
ncbi:MAG: phosphoribosylaminoimidazolesuccinocarboxamide synthase [Gammaproteobacteria bacterium]|nr:phosphoribosylaminoimidazolesuccinocarboxamide synthase [Gammaproteobacteria bacterium]